MTRNLSGHRAQLLNPTISKFLSFLLHGYHTLQLIEKNSCYPSYCFLTPHYQNFTNPPIGIFFGLVIPLNLRIGANYVSIIITIISNITVCHDVNKKAPAIVSPTPLRYHVFTRLICCFTRNTLSTFFYSDRIIAKNNAFLK